MRTLRDVAIIVVLALFVAFAPSGGNFAEAILTAITMGFLAALAWMVFVLGRQNQLTLATLTDKRRAKTAKISESDISVTSTGPRAPLPKIAVKP